MADVREAGRIREGDPVAGKIVLDEKGQPYGYRHTQISKSYRMVHKGIWRCTDFHESDQYFRHTLHIAFDEYAARQTPVESGLPEADWSV